MIESMLSNLQSHETCSRKAEKAYRPNWLLQNRFCYSKDPHRCDMHRIRSKCRNLVADSSQIHVELSLLVCQFHQAPYLRSLLLYFLADLLRSTIKEKICSQLISLWLLMDRHRKANLYIRKTKRTCHLFKTWISYGILQMRLRLKMATKGVSQRLLLHK